MVKDKCKGKNRLISRKKKKKLQLIKGKLLKKKVKKKAIKLWMKQL